MVVGIWTVSTHVKRASTDLCAQSCTPFILLRLELYSTRAWREVVARNCNASIRRIPKLVLEYRHIVTNHISFSRPGYSRHLVPTACTYVSVKYIAHRGF